MNFDALDFFHKAQSQERTAMLELSHAQTTVKEAYARVQVNNGQLAQKKLKVQALQKDLSTLTSSNGAVGEVEMVVNRLGLGVVIEASIMEKAGGLHTKLKQLDGDDVQEAIDEKSESNKENNHPFLEPCHERVNETLTRFAKLEKGVSDAVAALDTAKMENAQTIHISENLEIAHDENEDEFDKIKDELVKSQSSTKDILDQIKLQQETTSEAWRARLRSARDEFLAELKEMEEQEQTLCENRNQEHSRVDDDLLADRNLKIVTLEEKSKLELSIRQDQESIFRKREEEFPGLKHQLSVRLEKARADHFVLQGNMKSLNDSLAERQFLEDAAYAEMVAKYIEPQKLQVVVPLRNNVAAAELAIVQMRERCRVALEEARREKNDAGGDDELEGLHPKTFVDTDDSN